MDLGSSAVRKLDPGTLQLWPKPGDVVKISSLKNGGMSLGLAKKIMKEKSYELQATSLTGAPGSCRMNLERNKLCLI